MADSITKGISTSAAVATGSAAGSTPVPPVAVIVPDEAQRKYPALVELILKSESMNSEERNYWLQVLPVMTPDQIKELEDILTTEKKKLAAIDAKYTATGTPPTPAPVALSAEEAAQIEAKRQKARQARQDEERKDQETEAAKESAILAELATL